MAEPKRTLRGEYTESCNCDDLCPCIALNPIEAAQQERRGNRKHVRADNGMRSGEIPLHRVVPI